MLGHFKLLWTNLPLGTIYASPSAAYGYCSNGVGSRNKDAHEQIVMTPAINKTTQNTLS